MAAMLPAIRQLDAARELCGRQMLGAGVNLFHRHCSLVYQKQDRSSFQIKEKRNKRGVFFAQAQPITQ
jgi:hypothetical protein